MNPINPSNDPIVYVIQALIEEATWVEAPPIPGREIRLFTASLEHWNLTLAIDALTQDGAATSKRNPTLIRFTPELARLAREKVEAQGKA
jgi:hypothetical protein